ncbi:MAG: M17 family metallopeptidase [Thermomicrobiales bacterium]
MAEVARETARNVELEYEVFDEKQLAEMGAGAIVAVGQGSEHLPRLVRMTYTPSGESKATIALVGKGITFDTGGMSLKTGEGMVPMKTDMAGSAAVLGAMRAVAELDLPITVHGIIAAAENMPSDTAYRPSDVLKAMNGKTIEVISTDAEGTPGALPTRLSTRPVSLGGHDRPGNADRREGRCTGRGERRRLQQ